MATETGSQARKRERSSKYPGRTLAESVEFARFVEERGLDGLSAAAIAVAQGFSNVKTNAFSAALSAARQFGLLELGNERYSLTPLARSILHPVDPSGVPVLLRTALWHPPLYGEIAAKWQGKVVPEAAILANLLYHQFKIIHSAKDTAAEVFLSSARFAGALDDRGALVLEGVELAHTEPAVVAVRKKSPGALPVRLDLRLWGDDAGKVIRVRAPETISAESFERLVQLLRLSIKVE